MKNYFIKNKRYLIFVFCIILAITLFSNLQNQKFKEIESKGKIEIAKFSYFKNYVKSCNYYFVFFYNKKKITNYIIKVPKGFSQNIGKFYKIKYLPKYPDLIIVEFDKEVTDTFEILKSGFKLEEITR